VKGWRLDVLVGLAWALLVFLVIAFMGRGMKFIYVDF
jgi:hypothetical protein